MSETATPTHVLSKGAVRWGIGKLSSQAIHPTFLLYLYLRTQARAGKLAAASPSDESLLALMRMPGHATKPWYFPLVDRAKDRSKPIPQAWRANNVPGRWSPGSIRPESPGGWLLGPGSTYAWPDNHDELAFEKMLYGKPVPALAMGAYFLRNDGFVLSGDPAAQDIIAGFRAKFDYPDDADDEFARLFTTDVPDDDGLDWFDLFVPAKPVDPLASEESSDV